MTFGATLDVFTDVLNRLPDEPGSAQGLDLAVETIERVINDIDKQLLEIDPHEFENQAHISGSSFGGADRASDLSVSHTRAHAVTAATLRGVVTDLRTFQAACRFARDTISETDLAVRDDLAALTNAVTTIAAGARSNQADALTREAQVEHKDDQPTDEPPAGSEF